MPKDVVFGYHPITKDIVNVWYKSEKNNHKIRVVGVREGWMICDESNGSKWINHVQYDHYQHAIDAYP